MPYTNAVVSVTTSSQTLEELLGVELQDGMHSITLWPEGPGIFWNLDDFNGVFYLNKIVPGRDAHAHVNMLDGRFKGREEVTKRLLKYVFDEYDFHRLTVQVPVYIKPNVIRFIRRLGFVSEGRIREVVPYHDKWFDVFVFGILKDEIILRS